MAKGIRYSDEFKQEAVNQITKLDYPRFGRHLALFAPDLFKRLGAHSV